MSCYGGQGQGLVHSQPFHLLHERQKDDADNDKESDLNLGWYSGVIGDDFDGDSNGDGGCIKNIKDFKFWPW